MNLFIILCLILGASVWAADLTKAEFNIGDQEVSFVHLEQKHITISASCMKPEGSLKCKAADALKKADDTLLKPDGLGRNPGARLCEEQFHQKVRLSTAQNGDERTFCEFSDGSLVGTGTLAYYGNKSHSK
jgi:hypothetical protein